MVNDQSNVISKFLFRDRKLCESKSLPKRTWGHQSTSWNAYIWIPDFGWNTTCPSSCQTLKKPKGWYPLSLEKKFTLIWAKIMHIICHLTGDFVHRREPDKRIIYIASKILILNYIFIYYWILLQFLLQFGRCLIIIWSEREQISVASGGGNAGTPPPRNRKNCCRKRVLSSRAIYFRGNGRNMRNIHENILVQTRNILHAGLLFSLPGRNTSSDIDYLEFFYKL